MIYEHHKLDDHTLNWVKNYVNPQAMITSIRALKGSTSSSLYHIRLEKFNVRKDVVLRQFDHKEWVQEEPDLALHEASSLTYASQANVNTPQLIAYDATGNICGVPMVLMTMVEGNVQLQPVNMDRWLHGLATALASIHQLDGQDFKWDYGMYQDIDTFAVPSCSAIPDVWERIIAYVKQPPPAYQACFIHRDYHPTNVLFNDDVVSGVVDWVNACRGL